MSVVNRAGSLGANAPLESGEVGTASFPFLRLPHELRVRIWQYFCPDLTGLPRALEFNIELGFHAGSTRVPTNRAVSYIYTGGFLDGQTLLSRRMLAVHRESRELVLAAMPHSVFLKSSQGGTIIRFNRDRDVIMLHVADEMWFDNEEEPPGGVVGNSLPAFQDQVVNLAISRSEFQPSRDGLTMEPWLRSFPNLKRLFLFASYIEWEHRLVEDEDDEIEDYESEDYESEDVEIEDYESEDVEIADGRWYAPGNCNRRIIFPRTVACWPDVLTPGAFDEEQLLRWSDSGSWTLRREWVENCHVETWPMILLKHATSWEASDLQTQLLKWYDLMEDELRRTRYRRIHVAPDTDAMLAERWKYMHWTGMPWNGGYKGS